MTYSLDMRKKILTIRCEEGLSMAEVAKRFGVGVASVMRWSKNIECIKKRNRSTKIDMEAIKKDVETYPDAYQSERAGRLGVSEYCVWYALKRLGVTYKKTLNHPKADPERRSAFCTTLEEYKDQRRPLVFLDASGFAHDMPRLHGYSAKGSRCFGTHDWGAKGRTNVIGALLSGVLLTISLFETTINTVIFDAWVIQDLVPKLPKNSVVIMGNASFHKGQDMVNALKDAGHRLLYMPPYSPDLNPIEKNGPKQKPKGVALGVALRRCL